MALQVYYQHECICSCLPLVAAFWKMVCCMHTKGPCTNANDFEMTFATIESYDV
jgi:hypothetical protein